jgi:hypothetical protein
VSRSKGGYLSDYLFDRRVGWIPGMVTPTGLALLFILLIMGLFSHRMVRKSGRFEVNGRSAACLIYLLVYSSLNNFFNAAHPIMIDTLGSKKWKEEKRKEKTKKNY